MIHDEKTTEIELPWAKKSEKTSSAASKPATVALKAAEESKEKALLKWVQELDMNAPWVLRLLAVIAILLLSLLVV